DGAADGDQGREPEEERPPLRVLVRRVRGRGRGAAGAEVDPLRGRDLGARGRRHGGDAAAEDREEDEQTHQAAPRAAAILASKSARYLVMKPSIGQAAASPSAHIVLPAIPCEIEDISSMSPGRPCPSATRVQTRASQPVPSRQGVHWPQLSWA